MLIFIQIDNMSILVGLVYLFIYIHQFVSAVDRVSNNELAYSQNGNLKNAQSQHEKCDRITVQLCQDTPYNYTRMPNMLGHYDQHMVSMAVQEYKPLIEVQCSEHLKFFLCSIFTPMCTDTVDTTITSCRSVCEEVKSSCLPLLKNFGFSWPDMLNCSQFPAKGTGALCMDPLPESGANSKSSHKHRPGHYNRASGNNGKHDGCPSEFIDLIHADSSTPCAVRCDRDWMFKGGHKRFVEWWMSVLSILCILITAFTIVTFCLDPSRFRYPERSIVFLSICYNLYAWGYILRLIFTYEETSCQTLKNGNRFLIAGSIDNWKCVTIFMILYYFGMASAVWWVVLTFTWFLAAAYKWGQEAIATLSSYFHSAAWGIPALLMLFVLITRQVDASELTGLCFVGQHNSRALLGFVIAPMTILLIIGLGFLVGGFVSMFRIRQEIRNRARDSTDLNKLEKLMVKIGIFAFLYVIPALTVIGCYIYEKIIIDEWSYSAYASFCAGDVTAEPSIDNHSDQLELGTISAKRLMETVQQRRFQREQYPSDGIDDQSASCLHSWLQVHSRPRVDVHMLKIFMTLIVGITSGMWVWSRKTCVTWHRQAPCCSQYCLCCRLFGGPTGIKTNVVQYPHHTASAATAVGIPLLAGQNQHSQPSSTFSAHRQTTSSAMPNRGHLQHTSTTSSYHRHHNRNPIGGSTCTNAVPMQTFQNGHCLGSNFPSGHYATTVSSEASAKI